MDPYSLEPLDSEPVAQAAREAAFSAPAFHWKDIPLHPFAIAREADWMAHCRRIGLPPIADASLDPEMFLGHAIRLLWFCAHSPETWLAPRMNPTLYPYALDLAIRAWVDDQITGDEYPEAIKLAIAIYDRAHATQAMDADPPEPDDSGKAHGL